MVMFAEVATSNAIVLGTIVLAAILVFWILKKIVKLVFSLLLVALIAAVAVFWCVKAGYLSSEDAEKLNPLNNEQVRQAAKDVGAWAGAKVKEAARKAVDVAVKETVDRAAPTNSLKK